MLLAPHGAYRCQGLDRWCTIAIFTDEEWQSLCEVMGNPVWTQDNRFTTFTARKENEDELDRLVETWTVGRTRWEVMEILQNHGVPAGVVETGEDLVTRDKNYSTHNYYVELPYGKGKAYCEDTMIGLSDTPCKVRRAAPDMGEHNNYVFGELLGMTEDEIVQCYIEEAFL